MRKAAQGELKGILGFNELPLVSMDFNHCQNSSTLDANGTKVIDGNFARILSWYDNEWGFSNRMSDVAVEIAKTL
jgi:glyceraldehyde 3-phosphate dehydrogenase